MFVELIYGVLTNSLGLISDSAHMFFDSSALVLSLLASYFASFPPSPRFNYGYRRIEVLSGLTNCIFLIFVAFSIVMESIERLINPQIIHSDKLLTVAILGLVVNLIGIFFFHAHSHTGHEHHGHHSHDEIELESKHVSSKEHHSNTCEIDMQSIDTQSEIHKHNSHEHHNHDHHNHCHGEHDHHVNENLSGVFLHILADALGSVGVIISATLIKYFDLIMADAICSLIISGLILASIVPLLKSTLSVLTLHAPIEMKGNLEAIGTEILSLKDVCECTQLKIWRFKKDDLVATLQVEANPDCNTSELKTKLRNILKQKRISHSTIEIRSQSIASDLPLS